MSNHSDMIIYQIQDGLTKIDVAFDNDTVWLSLDQMAKLFQRDKSVISRHIRNIYSESELSREGTVAKMQQFKWKVYARLNVLLNIIIWMDDVHLVVHRHFSSMV